MYACGLDVSFFMAQANKLFTDTTTLQQQRRSIDKRRQLNSEVDLDSLINQENIEPVSYNFNHDNVISDRFQIYEQDDSLEDEAASEEDDDNDSQSYIPPYYSEFEAYYTGDYDVGQENTESAFYQLHYEPTGNAMILRDEQTYLIKLDVLSDHFTYFFREEDRYDNLNNYFHDVFNSMFNDEIPSDSYFDVLNYNITFNENILRNRAREDYLGNMFSLNGMI